MEYDISEEKKNHLSLLIFALYLAEQQYQGIKH